MEALNERSASVFLALLLCGDLVFMVLHFVVFFTPGWGDPLFSVEQDMGYPEMYQYQKFFWITALLIYFSRKNRSLHYIAWGLVFTYMLFDDAMQLHERIGGLIAANLAFAPPLGLRLQDLGELAVTATAGAPLSIGLAWAYWSGSRTFRKVSQDIALLLLILVFFGVFFDMVLVVLYTIGLSWEVLFVFEVVEDGGEMLAASLILWYTFLLNMRDDDSRVYICDLLSGVLTRRST